MICYLDSKSDTVLKICTPQKFDELIYSQRTEMLINAYRSGENPDAKGMLPAIVLQGYDPKMLEKGFGSRKKADLVSTGIVMLDFDHLKEKYGLTPFEVHDKFMKLMPSLGLTLEHDFVASWMTASGDGTRLALRLPKGKTIAQYQKYISDKLGLECDKAVKDMSRLSFVPKAEDIFYINKPLMFAPVQTTSNDIKPNQTTLNTNSHDSKQLLHQCAGSATDSRNAADNRLDEQPYSGDGSQTLQTGGNDSATAQGQEEPQSPTEKSTKQSAQSEHGAGGAGHPDRGTATDAGEYEKDGEGQPAQDSAQLGDDLNPANLNPESLNPGTDGHGRPLYYRGIPYKDIVEKWIQLRGGVPEPGDRHATLIALAMDLRKITDNDKEWLASLMPDFGKGDEEKMSAIEWAVSQKPTLINGTLKEVLKYFKIDKPTDSQSQGQSQSEAELPPEMPEQLPSLIELLTRNVMPHQKAAVATMVFPALSVYTNDATFKLADNANYELSLMSVLVGKQSVGKGCIDQPIERILKRIEQQDRINRMRESEWKDRDRRRKASERGEKKPAVPIRLLNSDTTNAAFLMRLTAAEEGDGERRNLTTFTQVSEIESLYKFCSTSGALNVAETIKNAWDRKLTGADRVTTNAVCARTPLRWNFCASTTVGGAKKFFGKLLADGVTSRIDYCTIIPPTDKFRFRYGEYTKEFNEELRPYIDNLENFHCERDEEGKAVPIVLPRVIDMELELDQYIEDVAGTEPDDCYEDYAYRAKVMAVKKLIILYIANGCKWEDTFVPFIWWSFKYSMWCKMNLFYDAAAEAFKDEQIRSSAGQRTPLKEMTQCFTLAQFSSKCERYKVKQLPDAILRKYKSRGIITQSGDHYIINPDWCRKNNIPLQIKE